MSTTIITALRLADATDLSACGGKAANLARLLAAGAPVPDGLVLTNDALQHSEIDAAPLLALMADGPVIVRSSAIGEDSDEASFAGQLESIANVRTEPDLRNAIARVCASQHAERVVAYQRLRNKPLAGMGIVIQRQVDAVVSGVLFTESPMNPGEMLLEYSAGLGEALVQGEVDPGRIVISRSDVRRSTRIAEAEGGVALTGQQIETLARLALTIERIFDQPQDIEWTIGSNGALWIVQSRAITTPQTAPGPRSTDSEGRTAKSEQRTADSGSRQVWSNANVGENFPEPICPLLYSFARVGYYHYFRNLGRVFGISRKRLDGMEPALQRIIGVHGARMYYNLSSIHAVLRSAPFGDLLAVSFNQFVGSEDTSTRPAGAAYRVRQAFELGVIAANTTWQYLFVTRRVGAFERLVDAYASATDPNRLPHKSLRELLGDFRAFLDIRYHRWTNASLADAASMVCYGLLQRLLARSFPQRDQQALHNTLLKALPDLVSGIPPLKLWELSTMIREDRDLRVLVENAAPEVVLDHVRTNPQFCAFRRAFDDFLEQWGFRCSSELMLTAPSFQEEPARVLALLKGYVAIDGESPADLLKRQAAERERETAAVLGALRRRSIVQWLVTRTILRWTQRSIQLRERARLKQALLYSRLRRVALAMGHRLAAAGRLHRPDDVFFLTAGELELLAAGGEMFPNHVLSLVTLRRTAHAEVSATTPADSFELAEGEYLDRSKPLEVRRPDAHHAPERAYDMQGVAACSGTSTAPAAILHDASESDRLHAGDVLVTRQTDPGWAPIFPLVSGLVIERGGMLSHGAIIAREFGIPSVVGVKEATRRIAHGSRITVDGNRGLVHLATEGTAQ